MNLDTDTSELIDEEKHILVQFDHSHNVLIKGQVVGRVREKDDGSGWAMIIYSDNGNKVFVTEQTEMYAAEAALAVSLIEYGETELSHEW